mgnify:CR=1 FL=1
MKVVILAGGLGTRISEESVVKPKPLVEIGGKPIIWHIMKLYSQFGLNDFIVCCGYKGYLIKEYFAMQKASKWFEKNPAAQARFEDLEDWLEEVEERLERIEEHVGIEDDE